MESASLNAKIVFATGKVMRTVFCDSPEVHLRTGNIIYRASLLNELKAEIEEKRSHLQKKKIPFVGLYLVGKEDYSPDIAQNDFFLFIQLKITLREQLICREKRQVLFERFKEMETSLGELSKLTITNGMKK